MIVFRVGVGRCLGRWEAVSGVGPLASEHAEGPVVRAVAPQRRPVRLAWEQIRLPGLLRASDAEVHHGPHYTMPERARLPQVVTIHDLTFLDHPEWHEKSKVRVFGRAIKVAARRAAALVCVSTSTAGRLEEIRTSRRKPSRS